jgi:hypothetical protein
MISGVQTSQDSFIIIQTADHPEFIIEESDSIIYSDVDGEFVCNEIHEIKGVGMYERYYTSDEESCSRYPIYQSQVIGKVIKTVDNNIWNELSIKLWELSISNLNFRN